MREFCFIIDIFYVDFDWWLLVVVFDGFFEGQWDIVFFNVLGFGVVDVFMWYIYNFGLGFFVCFD